MPAKTHVVKAVFPVLCVSMLALQNGCSNSGGGNTQTPTSNASAIHLSLSTTTGFTAVVADGSSTIPIRIQVTNASGAGMSGVPVTFATTAGALSASPVVRATRDVRNADETAIPRADSGGSVTVPTDTNGIGQVLLTASTTVGTAVVTADALGFRTNITIDFVPGSPARVQLNASPTTVNAGGTATLTATVTDVNGNPNPGETVTFTLSTNTSGATLSAASGVTDSNGQASVQYTAGITPGADTVRAQVTSSSVAGSTSVTVTAPPGSATSIDLLVSSPQLASDASGSVTLTALVRDVANNAVSGVLVRFAADSGSLQVERSGTTEANGTAAALLTTLGDPTNRTITVTASIGNLSSTNMVQVEGTTLSVSGVTTIIRGSTTRLTILLRDSAGVGIQNRAIRVRSAQGNTLSAPTVTTDANGQTTVDVTGNITGTDSVTVDALGATATALLSVSASNFVLTTVPTPVTEVPLNTPQSVKIHWDEAGVPQGGKTITFFATRGNFTATPTCPMITVCTTDANGDTIASIFSNNAGSAVISAVAAGASGPTSQISIEFISTAPTSLILQATLTSLAVNQQSVITAVVRDAQGNLVKDQTVSFSLTDVSGGRVSPASAVTDSLGRASTVYTAGAVPSANNGVVITAAAAGTPGDTIRLTVAQQALFVVLGTANNVVAPSTTQYALAYSVLVTDANGTPIANATVALNISPTQYRKGSCGGPNLTCPSEDGIVNPILKNGILDPGEDRNGNTFLDPGNVATVVPRSVTTDTSGFAFFDVVYAQEFAELVQVELDARTVVVGSEESSQVRFFLPGACVVPPSPPFGLATNTCTDNDFP
jgi:hypothetical protein